MKEYDHKKIEIKWQKEWDKKKLYEVKNTAKGKKFYGLIEFPYPSGAGLHVGHIRSNTAMDIISRKRRMEGYNVLYPIGWDAFGLPTENFAIKTGIQPAKVTKQNTDTFRRQLKSLGFSFDWSREINTTDPAYYKWTQWIFLQMYKKGLAYKAKTEINWCPKDKIGLANEEAEGGICDRCGGPTEKRVKEQWMLAITKYADRLDKDLDDVNYLEKIKIQQRNWIGKSVGSEIDFAIKNSPEKIKVFTTRADTLFGVTYVVLAPEHELVNNLKTQIKNWAEVEKYIKDVKKKTDIERTDEGKEKTGVKLEGINAINPANNEEVPVYVADYVLPHYGTGAVMAVPAHDERDFTFAKKYNLPIKNVISLFTHIASGADAVKENLPLEEKQAVWCIVKHWSEDKYLFIEWNKKYANWTNFITGGIDTGEDVVQTAIREVAEESGYVDVKKAENLNNSIIAEFYHTYKNKNFSTEFHWVYIELASGKQVSVLEEEKDKHTTIWIDKNKVESFHSTPNGKYGWRVFTGLESKCFTDDGKLVNSGKFNRLNSEEARKQITEFVGGKIVTKFKLRDWVFSRQRYWGEPIPIVNCEKCGYVPLSEKDLPLELPKVKSYAPTDNGESPLANITAWVNTKCPKCKGKAKRETDTMPNWAGSSWYFLRYTDPKNKKEFANKNVLKYWMKNGIDWYNGGMEHTTLHLLYSRFWHKFLYDLKVVPTSEPYMKRTSHGMILAEGGEKMSKSVGNTVNPDEIVKLYGADTLRMYEMFMGPFDQAVSWSTESMIGPRRFLERVWRLGVKNLEMGQNRSRVGAPGERVKRDDFDPATNSSQTLQTTLNKTIKKVTEDIENMNFNTAVSSMMVLLNEMEKCESVNIKDYKIFLQILAPFAPHIAEDLWMQMGEKKSIHLSKWPKFDPKKLESETVKIGVQVNGKVRAELVVGKDDTEEDVKERALSDENVIKWIENKEIKKVIYVKGRLLNIVI